MRRLSSVLIILAMLFGMVPAASAADSPFDMEVYNGVGAVTAGQAVFQVTQGGSTFPVGCYYYFTGEDPADRIRFRLAPKNNGIGLPSPGEGYILHADFSEITGDDYVEGSWADGYWSFDCAVPDVPSEEKTAFSITVSITIDNPPMPLTTYPVATMIAVLDVNPADFDNTFNPLTTTDWADIEDFTYIEELVFDKYISSDYSAANHLGTLVIGDATHRINLCELDTNGQPVMVQALSNLEQNLDMALGSMSMDTAADALAALNKPSSITMYNLPYESSPGLMYQPASGEPQVLIDPGETEDGSGKVTGFTWNDAQKSLEFSATGWSGYQSFMKVTATANGADGIVTMVSGNTSVSGADNKWVLTVTAGTVANDVDENDVTVDGLPSGLSVSSVAKGTGNTIEITLGGTANPAVTAQDPATVVVKASALSETTGFIDSDAVTVYVNPAPAGPQLTASATDDTITMGAPANVFPPMMDTWLITVTGGTVDNLVAGDVVFTGVPSGLTPQANAQTASTIIVALTGQANSAVNLPQTITAVVKGSAVIEAGASDAPAVNLKLNPAPVTVAATASDSIVRMNSGNTALSGNNSWTLEVTAGILKDNLTTNDISVTLPQGLSVGSVAKVDSNSLTVTLSGTATNPINAQTSVNLVVKGSAVVQPGSSDSAAVSVSILPALAATVTLGDNMAQMATGNLSVSPDNSWTLSIDQITVNAEMNESNLSVSGLPEGMSYDAAKGDENTIVITVTGTPTAAVTSDVTVSIIVKGSAATEADAVDSQPVDVTLATDTTSFQITASGTDTTAAMAAGNMSLVNNTFAIEIVHGTPDPQLTADDLTITGLPAGLSASTSLGQDKTITLIITGTPNDAVTQDATVSVVVKPSAVLESPATQSSAVNMTLDASETQFQVVAAASNSNQTVTMAADNKAVSTDNTWTLNLTAGTLRQTLQQGDVTITGLPEGLTATAERATATSATITVSGTAATALTGDVTVSATVNATAVLQSPAANASAVSFTLAKCVTNSGDGNDDNRGSDGGGGSGSGTGTTTVTPPPVQPEPASATVQVNTGGTVALADNSAAVTIPAGATSQDVRVTVKPVADSTPPAQG